MMYLVKIQILKILSVKSVHIQSYFGPHFHSFGLNTDQNNFEYEHFLRNRQNYCRCRKSLSYSWSKLGTHFITYMSKKHSFE